MLQAAAANTAYCTANIKNATSTKFAAVTPTSYLSPSPNPYSSATAGSRSGNVQSSAEKFGVDFALKGLALVLSSFILVG